MNVFLSLSYLDPVNTSITDNATLVQCPIKLPLASWDSSSFEAAAKVSTLVAVTVNFITMPFTIFFNALIIFLVWKNPSLQIERVIVLAYLALADLMVGLLCQPLFIARGVSQLKTNSMNCDINNGYISSQFFFGITASIQLALVTYERYVAIIHPYQYPTRITVKRLTYATIVIWSLNMTVSILLFALLAFGEDIWYIDILYIPLGIFLTSAMVYWYVCIFVAIRRQRKIGQQQQNVNMNNVHTQQNYKGAITAALLLGCFLVSLIPLLCTFLLKRVLGSGFSNSVFLFLRPWGLTFVQLASFINPIIYGLRVRELRRKCFQLVFRIQH
ncbi:trace amine-associated receptor 13c-like [Actinia tenebrosa]|uniref:Trace amine-associated receptor 13c-like n=1 Tax=Actinia tenebrosa TaxID=6105 RepID=A0A6P8J139_ACTTE|nr:trace amine-associated receptor 13c-like [Actinia tenebrosa]